MTDPVPVGVLAAAYLVDLKARRAAGGSRVVKAPMRMSCVYCHRPIRQGANCRIVPADAMRPEQRLSPVWDRCAHPGCAVEHGPTWMRPKEPRKPSPPRCKEPDCHKRVKARGWCSMHYNRWLRSAA